MTTHTGTRKRQHKRHQTKTTMKYGGGKKTKRVKEFLGRFVPRGLVRRGARELSTPETNKEPERFPNEHPGMITPEGSSEEARRMGPAQKRQPSPIPTESEEELRMGPAQKRQPSPIPTESEEERASAATRKKSESPSEKNQAGKNSLYVSLAEIRGRKRLSPPPLPRRMYKPKKTNSPNSSKSSEHIYDVLPPKQPPKQPTSEPHIHDMSPPRHYITRKQHKQTSPEPKKTQRVKNLIELFEGKKQ